jgi:dolichol-phosphate mannosyltransferase
MGALPPPSRAGHADDVQVSVVVPALNEAANLAALAARVDAAMRGTTYELLVIDDGSTDGTPAVCAALAEQFPLSLHVRPAPHAGLSGAVLEGFTRSRGDVLVVMDADLQHPPERIPALLAALDEPEVDVAIGSRYAAGGTTATRWGIVRRLNSRVATLLARPFAGDTHDPMSGFFAIRRATLAGADQLTPLGYKIGLELMCKCRVRRVAEVPIHFAERAGGESKLTVKQQFKYLEHLSRLYDFCFPRLSPIVKFVIVTTISWFVAFAVFVLLLKNHWAGPPWTTSIAYLFAVAVTALFHGRYVRTQREFLVRKRPWIDFLFSSLAEWAACSLTAVYLTVRLENPHDLELFFFPFGVALFVRYVLRKEFMLDVRGLRRMPRDEEIV